MTAWMAIVGMIAAVSPVRLGFQLQRMEARTRLVGIGAAGVAVAVVGVLAEPALDALDVSEPNARITAGIVVGLTALVDLVRRSWAAVEAGGPAPWLVPVAWPVVLRPVTVILALAIGTDLGVGWALGAALVATVCAAAVLTRRWRTDVAVGLHSVIAVSGLLVAVQLVVDGVLDV